jgi:hypothetical protein
MRRTEENRELNKCEDFEKRKRFNVAVDFCYNWERSAEHGGKECVLLDLVCFGLICLKWLNDLPPFSLGASNCAAER